MQLRAFQDFRVTGFSRFQDFRVMGFSRLQDFRVIGFSNVFLAFRGVRIFIGGFRLRRHPLTELIPSLDGPNLGFRTGGRRISGIPQP